MDGSRVHPETYEWARKMAVDALEYDDQAEDANPAGYFYCYSRFTIEVYLLLQRIYY